MLMQGANDLEPYWKRWLRYAWKWRVRRKLKLWLPVIIVMSVAAALVGALVVWGVYDNIATHCRSKSDPKVYGLEFCIPPATQPSAKSRG